LNIKSTEKKDNNEVEVVVEIEPEELETEAHKVFVKNRNRISVPGFRKGKAPRKIIERMYGAEIFISDALEELLPGVLSFAIKECEHNIVGYPKISEVNLKDDNKYAEITLIAALHPEVTLKKYKGLVAPKPDVEITDSEIDNEIERVRERNARIEKADRAAQDGDIAVINFEGFVDGKAFEGGSGENYELTLGSGQFIPGFEEKIEGMTAGEERDIELVFPEQYKENLAGKPVVFKVKLCDVKEKILPELDNDFAVDISEFDTLDEYKADLRKKRLEVRQKDADETFENLLLEQLVDLVEADVPETMVDEQYDNSMNALTRQISAYGMQPAQYMQMMGLTPEQFKDKMRESSLKQVKSALALEKIAELENIEVSGAEIEDEYDKAAKRFSMEVDKLKETITDDDIIRDIKLRKATKIVVESATIGKAEDIKENSENVADDGAAKKPVQKKSSAKKTKKDETQEEKQ